MKIMNILTWNMQGYGGVVEKAAHLQTFLNCGEFDVICLQESTQVLGCFRYIDNIGILNNIEVWQMEEPRHPRRVNHLLEYTAYHYPWGNGNFRCSLTIYVRNRNIVPCDIIDSPFQDTRPMLWVVHDDLFIGNIHLISGHPHRAFVQFNHFLNQVPAGPHCIIGDYNIDALDVHERINDPNIYHVTQRTQLGEGCLDYMYSDIRPIRFDRLADAGVYSDHAPVGYGMPRV